MKPYLFVIVVYINYEALDKVNEGTEYYIYSVKLYYICNI